MKYLKISLMIMAICMTLTAVNSYALENGEVHFGSVLIDVWGSYKTAPYLKQTDSSQYARKLSCRGEVTGIDYSVRGRTDKVDSSDGDWTPLGKTSIELYGDDTKSANSYYEFNLKDMYTGEKCYFVGSWTYN